jgi:hypothetical protein
VVDQDRPHEGTKPMISRLPLLALAGALTLAGGAHAADTTRAVDTYLAITGNPSAPAGPSAAADALAPLDARAVALGGGSAVVYYTFDEGGADLVRVVTTVRTDPDGAGAPARFVSHLAPGQTAEVSVAGAAGAGPASLELAYDGGLLTVRPVAAAQPEG